MRESDVAVEVFPLGTPRVEIAMGPKVLGIGTCMDAKDRARPNQMRMRLPGTPLETYAVKLREITVVKTGRMRLPEVPRDAEQM